MLFVITGLLWGSVYGIQSMIASHDAKTEAHYDQQLAASTAQAQATEERRIADEKAHAIIDAQLLAQLSADQVAMKQRDNLMAQLVAKIQTMTVPQVVADLQPKLRAGTATELPDGVKLDLPAARDVDAQMTEGTNAKANLATTQADLAKETVIASNAATDLATAKQAITDEQGKNAAQVKACNAEKDTIRSDAAKSKTKWALITGILGFLFRVATHA